ncbi:MAG: hypothetical protein JRH01_06855 [Deltaproteobacteria bacterium]|nr:hypothetical protein [Deltaproteobacteria bacterium]MBW2393509.1 hypothetical protein [Deltaproteobacteria bacterium]
MRTLVVLVSLVALGALFLSTSTGRSLLERLGIQPLRGRAPKDDRTFLLKACGGDGALVRERLAAERGRFPQATDAELHRKAIRRWFQERDGQT